MSVTSPVSASPGMSLLDWDEGAVHSYLSDLGLAKYEDVIYEHGITGDVLSVMDHAALQDLGISSLGHRLNVLRAVWELKKEQGIEMGEDDWKPQEAEEGEKVTQSHVDKLWELIMDQHDRLIHLEKEQHRMLAALEDNGIPLPVPGSAEGEVQGIPGMEATTNSGLGRTGSLKWKDFKEKGSDGEELEAGPSRHNRRASTLFPSSLASSSNSNAPAAPLTSDTPTFQDSFTPTTVSASYPFDSPLAHTRHDRDRNEHPPNATSAPQQKPRPVQPPTLTRLASNSASSPPPNNTGVDPYSSSGANAIGSSSKNTLAPPIPPSAPNSGPSPTAVQGRESSTGPSDKAKSQASAEARSAAKSFRVTLEDPCWKVLPAALKKYKINDDWKLYALFICFDNTERCLSYDEKPLLLFQKLKETGHRPVFMLRHIKDIRSPIAVAQQKQAQKLGLPASTTANLLPKIKPSSDTSVSPTKANASGNSLQPAGNRGDDGNTPNGGAFPELPSPGLRDADGSVNGGASGVNRAAMVGQTTATQGTGTIVGKDGNVQNVTYAVAIYPYIADRQDEFDVAVGSTYVILSKAKGWYIVEKDPDGLGVPPDSTQGWVPAGCLLELSQPISIVSPTSTGEIATYPGLSTLPPTSIISSSYAGNVLMDYEAKGDAELSLKEGDKVRVYKKYCHWSYTLKSDTGERGWVPSWFVGKAPNEGSVNGSTPSSATTPTPATTVLHGPGQGAEQGSAGDSFLQGQGQGQGAEERLKDGVSQSGSGLTAGAGAGTNTASASALSASTVIAGSTAPLNINVNSGAMSMGDKI